MPLLPPVSPSSPPAPMPHLVPVPHPNCHKSLIQPHLLPCLTFCQCLTPTATDPSFNPTLLPCLTFCQCLTPTATDPSFKPTCSHAPPATSACSLRLQCLACLQCTARSNLPAEMPLFASGALGTRHQENLNKC
eukprot:1153639-Pelagomonas_calceolata.AAC.10